MGLFSFLNKNKQGRTAQTSGRFSSSAEDEAIGERARAKRASHNADGGRRKAAGADPVLPEKKRARRRLVGAIALALAAAVGLPMLLDSEPKPLAGDIAIQIPSKEKAAPLPLPSDPAPVAAADTVDSDEEIIEPSKAGAADSRAVAQVDTARPAAAPAKSEPAKSESTKPAVPASKAAPKADPKAAASKAADKTAPKSAAKSDDAARARAILEDKQDAAKREAAVRQAAAGQRFVVQVAALASQEKASELQERLRGAGIQTFTQKQATPSGQLIRVRVGPVSKEDAEKLRARLQGLGLSGTLVPV